MPAKTIQGKYDLYTPFSDVAYTLTGGDRNATFGPTGTQGELNTICINFPGSLSGKIAVPVENDVKIRKMKLWPRGGYGLQNSPLYMAGKFYLQLGREDDGNFILYDETAVQIPNWGEWFDVDLILRGYRRKDGDSQFDFLQFSFAYDTAVFSCDDYNLQEDFVGQGVVPALEMIVETAGLANASNGQIF